jgi:hypothetical protein
VTTPELHTDEALERPHVATGAPPPPEMVKMLVSEASECFRLIQRERIRRGDLAWAR